jgi:septum formation protein
MNEQLILASASPRRKELLDQINLRYFVYPVDIDETPHECEAAVDYVTRVAAEKSKACIEQGHNSLPVLAADTSVVIGEHILGKPIDEAHAAIMLNKLSGKVHSVYSAISLRLNGDISEKSHFQTLSITEVKFRQITREEIKAYWKTGEPEGKAGGYAIQGVGSIFVESMKGSFSGVVGLPLFETAELLSQHGIRIIK